MSPPTRANARVTMMASNWFVACLFGGSGNSSSMLLETGFIQENVRFDDAQSHIFDNAQLKTLQIKNFNG